MLLAETPTLILTVEKDFIKNTENVIPGYLYYISYEDSTHTHTQSKELWEMQKLQLNNLMIKPNEMQKKQTHVLNCEKYIYLSF